MTLPAATRRAVLKRVWRACVKCGVNLIELKRVWRACLWLPEWEGYSYRDGEQALHGAWVAGWLLEQMGLKHLRYEIHHVKPRAEGGADTLENLETRCARCHRETTNDQIKGWAASPYRLGSLIKKPKTARKSRWPKRAIQSRKNPWPRGRRLWS